MNINRTESPFKWTGFRGAGHLGPICQRGNAPFIPHLPAVRDIDPENSRQKQEDDL